MMVFGVSPVGLPGCFDTLGVTFEVLTDLYINKCIYSSCVVLPGNCPSRCSFQSMVVCVYGSPASRALPVLLMTE